MQKEQLEECLAEGMSLEAVGKRVGKEEMVRLLGAGLSLREVADRLDRSLGTVRHRMAKYGLKPSPRRKRGTEDGPRETISRCMHHGETSFRS